MNTFETVLPEAFGWMVELLKEVALTFGGIADQHEIGENVDGEIKRIGAECGNRPDRLFERALKEIDNHNYRIAHAIFDLAHKQAEMWRGKDYKRREFEKSNFLFYAWWSGIMCAYALHGEPAKRILEKYNKKTNDLLRKLEDHQNTDMQITQIARVYLHFLHGLTFGMIVDKTGQSRDYASIDQEIAEYETALELYKNYETKPNEDELRRWIRECEDAIRDRMRRVERIRKPFYSDLVGQPIRGNTQ